MFFLVLLIDKLSHFILKEKYNEDFIKLLKANDVEIVDYGIVGNSEKAYETADKINGDGVDVIMCNMITFN